MRSVIVLGVGAALGLGATLSRRFAQDDLHVFVAGRTRNAIEGTAAAIRESGGQASAIACDATSEGDVVSLVSAAAAKGPIEVAIYNAGNNMPGDFLSMDASDFEACWRVCCFGGFLFARESLRLMVPNARGTLIFTGASAALRGRPYFAAFTAAKGGLRNLAQSLAREFGPQGIHVGHVVIDGGLRGDRILKGHPEFASQRGEDGLIDLEGVADVYEMLWRQPRTAWTQELDLRTFKEPF